MGQVSHSVDHRKQTGHLYIQSSVKSSLTVIHMMDQHSAKCMLLVNLLNAENVHLSHPPQCTK